MSSETRHYKFGNETPAAVGDTIKVPVAGWVFAARVICVGAEGYTVRVEKRLFELKKRKTSQP